MAVRDGFDGKNMTQTFGTLSGAHDSRMLSGNVSVTYHVMLCMHGDICDKRSRELPYTDEIREYEVLVWVLLLLGFNVLLWPTGATVV